MTGERQFSDEAIAVMRKYSWPGNVRQLENAVRRLGLNPRLDAITRAEVEAVLGNQPGNETAPKLLDGDKLSRRWRAICSGISICTTTCCRRRGCMGESCAKLSCR